MSSTHSMAWQVFRKRAVAHRTTIATQTFPPDQSCLTITTWCININPLQTNSSSINQFHLDIRMLLIPLLVVEVCCRSTFLSNSSRTIQGHLHLIPQSWWLKCTRKHSTNQGKRCNSKTPIIPLNQSPMILRCAPNSLRWSIEEARVVAYLRWIKMGTRTTSMGRPRHKTGTLSPLTVSTCYLSSKESGNP